MTRFRKKKIDEYVNNIYVMYYYNHNFSRTK